MRWAGRLDPDPGAPTVLWAVCSVSRHPRFLAISAGHCRAQAPQDARDHYQRNTGPCRSRCGWGQVERFPISTGAAVETLHGRFMSGSPGTMPDALAFPDASTALVVWLMTSHSAPEARPLAINRPQQMGASVDGALGQK